MSWKEVIMSDNEREEMQYKIDTLSYNEKGAIELMGILSAISKLVDLIPTTQNVAEKAIIEDMLLTIEERYRVM